MVVNNIPPIKLGGLEFSLIQGGMGVGISGANLASAVANEGGAGIIASVGLGVLKDYPGSYEESNRAAFRDEIRQARKKSNGVIGVNIMNVLSDYQSLVETAVEENVDLIISGAGIPRTLPKYLNGKNIKLVPIVSSAAVTDLICRSWARFNHIPDAILIEGPKAGGHLGYSFEQLETSSFIETGLEKILPEVLNVSRQYGNIPVIVAGGIFYGGDILRFNELGASGVQMATRFVTTNECDADIRFKQKYLNCSEKDIILIKSPVGLPGRAIINDFLRRVEKGEKNPVICPYLCLKSCVQEKSPYCIADALVEAQKGNLENGFAFCGTNAYRCKEIVSVKSVFESLDKEYSQNKIC